MMDPEMLAGAGAAQAAPAPDAAQMPAADEGDSGPLSKIELEPAEDGNVIATHHKKVPDRVRAMDPEGYKPHRHALKKDEVEDHVKKHKARLKS